MAYATQLDISESYGDRILLIVADRKKRGIVDTEAVTRALDSASAEIDSYLGIRYKTLPLPNPSEMLKTCCMDIAIYRMSPNETALTDEIRKRYDDAIAWLKLVAKGDVSAQSAAASTSLTGGTPSGPTQPGTGANIVPTVLGGLVTALTLVSGGTGYLPHDGEVPLIITDTTQKGQGAQGTATIVNGSIVGLKLLRPGAGYVVLPSVVPGLSGATLDPALYPPSVTGGKRAGMFFSQNRQGWPSWVSTPGRRTWPTA
jgi:phage gp36-like protein